MATTAENLANALFGDDELDNSAPQASEGVQPTIRDDPPAGNGAAEGNYGDEDDVLADLASDDDGAPKKGRLRKKKQEEAEDELAVEAPPQPKKKGRKSEFAGSDDDESDGEAGFAEAPDDEDEVKETKKPKKERKKKKRKAPSNESGDDSDGGAEGGKKKRRKKRAKKSERAEDDGLGDNVLDGKRSRKKSKIADRVDSVHKSEEQIMQVVVGFVEKMNDACDRDREANKAKQPGLNKLNMLPEVVAMLQKTHLQERLMKSEVLSAIRKWLEPLPDRSLPNLKIREALLKILINFPIWGEYVKGSGIGRIVMFLFKNDNETITNKTACKELIEKWSRPAFDLNARHTDIDRQDEQNVRRLTPRVEPELPPVNDPAITGEKPNLSHFRTRLPQRANFDFVRRPKTNDEDAAAGPAPINTAHLAAFEKKVLPKQSAVSSRAASVSITKIAPH